ncbi:LysR family transcriptional regulator [Lactobacillus hamsteri]|uniref:LysR family transcriptional regulator n=1 Tax=Lactobacillus hamsteri DSM 5661 = JCM 6256 TaxID=1423754 RepID=A0A0R1YEQ5_9LACO|nr:LysR family transcriptional regulator [Lactobacillus hamsteri]KRM40719.1 LysR family transcriptional regulator [Lactobacillus hamsteri DSM 5661 = JCM 6256]
MDVRVLRYFLAVCEEKNFTKAAQKLHIAQPSLSTQIKDLENELGVDLFIRNHRKLALTEEGYFLKDRAQEIVALTDNTTSSLESRKVVSGTLAIGAGQTLAMRHIMKIIDHILCAHPDVQIRIIDANADDVEARVNNGTLDFGVVMGERPLDDFNTLVLPEKNQFVAIFNKNLSLEKKKTVTPADLSNYPIISSNQTLVSDKFKNWWGNNDVKNPVNCNLSFNSSLLAEQGHMVQLTYAGLLDKGLDNNLVARPLEPEIFDPNIVIWKKNIKLSNLENLFLNELKKSLKGEHHEAGIN